MQQQSGLTLISLMVGLLISSISILTMMTLYKTLVHQAKESIDRSKLDGQVASGLLVAQMEIQTAGFGIDGAKTDSDLVVLSEATLPSDDEEKKVLSGTKVSVTASEPGAQGNAILWGQDVAGSGYKCSGLISDANGGLKLLKPSSCSQASDYSTIVWETIDLIAPGVLAADQTVSITALATSCWPFGKGSSIAAVLVSLSAGTSVLNTTPSSEADSTTKHIRTVVDICLPNIASS